MKRSFAAILRHCVVEVMTFVVFTISGDKGRFKIIVSIVIADFILIRNEKFKVIIQLHQAPPHVLLLLVRIAGMHYIMHLGQNQSLESQLKRSN